MESVATWVDLGRAGMFVLWKAVKKKFLHVERNEDSVILHINR